VALRFNPPPNWPAPPPGFVPPPRWQPDPAWPPPPPGWQLWVPDDSELDGPADYADAVGGPQDFTTGPADDQNGPADCPSGLQDFTVGSDDFSTGPQDFTGGPADFSGPGDFSTDPDDFSTGFRGFSTGTVDFSTGPGDFSTEPGDYTGGSPTALDPFPRPGAYPGGPSSSPGGPGAAAPPTGPANGWAIAAFILGLLGVFLLGIIFAIVALRQIGDSRQRGKGLAIAGLALSIIWGAALAVYLVLGNSSTPAGQSAGGGSHPSASSSSHPASPGSGHHNSQTSVFDLRTGQCFQNPPANQAVLGITYVTVVPCTTLHNAQVFVEFPATGSSYPGSSSLKHQADLGCHSRVAGNVETSKITSSMTLHFLYPLSTSWGQGHRTISCLIVDSKTELKSSLLVAHPKH
jgi:Domain of unknown function (DUF4190)